MEKITLPFFIIPFKYWEATGEAIHHHNDPRGVHPPRTMCSSTASWRSCWFQRQIKKWLGLSTSRVEILLTGIGNAGASDPEWLSASSPGDLSESYLRIKNWIKTHLHSLDLPLTHCLTLRKSFNLSVPQDLHKNNYCGWCFMGEDYYHIKHLSKTPFSNPSSEKK